MKFPLLNVSKTVWSQYSMEDYLLTDEYIYTANKEYFDRYLNDQLFCDCDGHIFKVVDKQTPKEGWRKALKFLPNVYKTKLIFEDTQTQMSVDELKYYMMNCVQELPSFSFQTKWLAYLQKAQTHEDLICGEVDS